jgi:hypothetical protein
MANAVAKKTEMVTMSRADLEALLAAHKGRKSATPAATRPETEVERVIRVCKMQNGFRGRILRYLVGKGAGKFTWAQLHAVEALADIDATNMAACMVHIAWKLQLKDAGWALAVDGRGESVVASLTRTAPVVKAPRARKAKVAPVAPAPAPEVVA